VLLRDGLDIDPGVVVGHIVGHAVGDPFGVDGIP
jgi:hypothetical protein